jgi:PAS domain S-box-containing protein
MNHAVQNASLIRVKKDKNMFVFLSILVGILFGGASIYLSQILNNREDQRIKDLTYNATISNTIRLENSLKRYIYFLGHIANQYDLYKGDYASIVRTELLENSRDYQGLLGIALVNHSYKTEWVMVTNQTMQQTYLQQIEQDIKEDKNHHYLEFAKNSGSVFVGNTVITGDKQNYFIIYVPIFSRERFQGFLVGVFSVYPSLDALLGEENLRSYVIKVYENQRLIYDSNYDLTASPSASQRDPFIEHQFTLSFKGDFRDVGWMIKFAPKPDLIKSLRSHLSTWILVSGLLISLLLAIAIYLYLSAIKRAAFLGQAIAGSERIKTELSDVLVLQQTVFDSINRMIIAVDLNGIIQIFNDHAVKKLGYEAEELIGKHTPNIFHDLDEIIDAAKRLSLELGYDVAPNVDVFTVKPKLGFIEEKEWTYIHKNGTRFPVILSITARRNKNGDVTGFVGIANDISHQKEAEAKLNQLIRELEQQTKEAVAANRAKSDFLAMMSHEIRTPMNGVIGMTGILLDTPLNQQQQYFAETIRNSGNALLTIINDILDFSKIESDNLVLESHSFDLIKCIESAIDLFIQTAFDKKLELAYYVDPKTPQNIIGDVTRLRQILVNLLGNAIKFTACGEITLSVSSELVSDSQPDATDTNEQIYRLKFSVRDTGIGIPEDRKDRLFKSFSQVDSSTTRKYGGTGLGLAISKKLTNLMGGEMWCESVLNEGATFTFTIEAKAELNHSLNNLSLNQVSIDRKHVLVVDDNATNLEIIQMQLESLGLIVTTTQFPDVAMAKLKNGESFDAAIIDWHMPVIDGLMLVKEIRDLEQKMQSTPLPIVFLNSFGHPDPQIADDLNINVIMTKPIRQLELKNILIDLISLPGHETSKESQQSNQLNKLNRSGQSNQFSSQKEILPSFDNLSVQEATVSLTSKAQAQILEDKPISKLGDVLCFKILLAEDNVVNQKVASIMLQKIGYRVDIVANGLEAVEAVKEGDYDVVFMDVQMPELDGLEATAIIKSLFTYNSDSDLTLDHNLDHKSFNIGDLFTDEFAYNSAFINALSEQSSLEHDKLTILSPRKKPYIIAMTANAIEGDREICLAAGMDDYVSKPLQINALRNSLIKAGQLLNKDMGL